MSTFDINKELRIKSTELLKIESELYNLQKQIEDKESVRLELVGILNALNHVKQTSEEQENGPG